jgi:hypothetical protein
LRPPKYVWAIIALVILAAICVTTLFALGQKRLLRLLEMRELGPRKRRFMPSVEA